MFDKKDLGEKKIGQKAIWVKTNFGTEKLLSPKKTMGQKKMLGLKKSYVQKFLSLKKSLV